MTDKTFKIHRELAPRLERASQRLKTSQNTLANRALTIYLSYLELTTKELTLEAINTPIIDFSESCMKFVHQQDETREFEAMDENTEKLEDF